MNVANPVKQVPELVILATGTKAVQARFQGWPDLILPPEVLSQLVSDAAQLAPEVQTKLRERGIMQGAGAAPVLTIPVYEQLPLAQWQQQIMDVATSHLPNLRSAVGKLQQAWSRQAGAPAWDKVAHSLLVNYLLWGVGGQLLLKLAGAAVAAAIVQDAGSSEAIWQGFVRYNQQYGVSCLLGSQYEHSLAVRDLLNKPDVVKTMSTLMSDRRLAVSEASARRTLTRLSALGGNREDDGTEKTSWPVLAASDLRAVKDSLLPVSKALLPILQQAVFPVVEPAKHEPGQFAKADSALVAYGLLVRIITDDWTEAKLLPPRVQPILNL